MAQPRHPIFFRPKCMTTCTSAGSQGIDDFWQSSAWSICTEAVRPLTIQHFLHKWMWAMVRCVTTRKGGPQKDRTHTSEMRIRRSKNMIISPIGQREQPRLLRVLSQQDIRKNNIMLHCIGLVSAASRKISSVAGTTGSWGLISQLWAVRHAKVCRQYSESPLSSREYWPWDNYVPPYVQNKWLRSARSYQSMTRNNKTSIVCFVVYTTCVDKTRCFLNTESPSNIASPVTVQQADTLLFP